MDSADVHDHHVLYLIVYCAIVPLLMITAVLKAVMFVKVQLLFWDVIMVTQMSLGAATKLHNRMFHRVIHGCARFFDTTPVGRILNRFTKDMDESERNGKAKCVNLQSM